MVRKRARSKMVDSLDIGGELVLHKVRPFTRGMETVIAKNEAVYSRESVPNLERFIGEHDGVEEIHVMVFPKKDEDYIQRIRTEGKRLGWSVRVEKDASGERGEALDETMVKAAGKNKEILDNWELAYELNEKPIFKKNAWVDARARACIIDFENTLVIQNKAKRYHSKDIISETATIVDGLSLMRDYIKLIFLSNSANKYLGRIFKFFDDNDISYDEIWCKSSGAISERDFKAERVAALKKRYNIMFAIDDNPAICEMYRDEFGLTVYQCSDAVQMKSWTAKKVVDGLMKNCKGRE